MTEPAKSPAPKTIAIVNERAGNGAMADIYRRLEHRIEDAVGPTDVAFTDGTGHATTLAREALAKGYTRILVGGGDGTINEVVNGFFDAAGLPINPEAELALLAGGTGGDYRKSVEVRDADETIAALAAGHTRRVDLGRLTYTAHDGTTQTRIFDNIAGFGLAGRVVSHVPRYRGLGGRAAYFGATLQGLWGWKNPRVRLTLDGVARAPQPIVTVAVGKGRFFGGGMMICPDARLDSGMFEVTVLGDLSRLELIMMSSTIYKGAHVYHPKVSIGRARVVLAEAVDGDEVLIDVDGEGPGRLPATFEVLPAALKLVAP